MDLTQLRKRCYAPYSGRRGIAVVESTAGHFFPGVRIENISFPLTISPEKAALYCCLSEGEVPHRLYTEQKEDPRMAYWRNEYEVMVVELGDAGPATEAWQAVAVHGEIATLLKQLLDRAVTGNSGFPVAAILETDDGLITGVNIESRAWDAGLCAERVVLAKALAYGHRNDDIKALHLHTLHGDYGSPCGACRQVIVEHLPHRPVLLHHPDGSVSHHFSSDLLPYSFKSEYLKHPKDIGPA